METIYLSQPVITIQIQLYKSFYPYQQQQFLYHKTYILSITNHLMSDYEMDSQYYETDPYHQQIYADQRYSDQRYSDQRYSDEQFFCREDSCEISEGRHFVQSNDESENMQFGQSNNEDRMGDQEMDGFQSEEVNGFQSQELDAIEASSDYEGYSDDQDYQQFQQRPFCRNGPNCSFFMRQACHFYHPPQHFQTLPQQRQPSPLLSLSAHQVRSNDQPHIRRPNQQIQLSLLSYLQQPSVIQPPRPIQKEYEHPFQWYFSRNKAINVSQLSKKQLEELHQCSICCSNFLQQVHPQIKPQIKQIKAKNKDATEITQLFCRHTFHKKCIHTWLLKPNHQCPICRVDFRDHKKYLIANYEIKISTKQQTIQSRKRDSDLDMKRWKK